jgi:hypothetical protein
MLAGEGNNETNHYITYNFNSNTPCKTGFDWVTKVAVYCEPEGKSEVTSADFTVTKDANTCEINISIRHPVGCPMVNLR